jgi:hypothetical protein
VKKVQEFESFYLSGERFEADIKLFDGVTKLIEFKSFPATARILSCGMLIKAKSFDIYYKRLLF